MSHRLRNRLRPAAVALAAAATLGSLTAAPAAAGRAAAVTPTTTAAATAAATPAGRPGVGAPGGLAFVRTKESLTGSHTWYRQTFKGLPVVDGYYARHTAHQGQAAGLSFVADGRRTVPATLRIAAAVSARRADATARQVLAARGRMATGERAKGGPVAEPAAPVTLSTSLAVAGGPDAALVWEVRSRTVDAQVRTLVDARSGAVREVTVVSKAATGKGRVFDANPVVALRNQSLRDRQDSNQTALDPAYRDVTLFHLDGNGKLQGRFARVVRAYGGLATSATNTFRYQRADNRFEQVTAYHAVDTTQTYIQSLGFTDVNNEPQDLLINTYTEDNSFYDPWADTLELGSGGVDDGEDVEVIWHEYGHAIQDDQVPDFGKSERAGAIGEGFGDYWAVTNAIPNSNGFQLPCVMDWDATSYTFETPHCLRRTDTGKTTADVTGQIHADGEIWSQALWRINRTLGRERADRVILESQFYYAPDTDFSAAAKHVVAAARQLYGATAADKVRAIFAQSRIAT